MRSRISKKEHGLGLRAPKNKAYLKPFATVDDINPA